MDVCIFLCHLDYLCVGNFNRCLHDRVCLCSRTLVWFGDTRLNALMWVNTTYVYTRPCYKQMHSKSERAYTPTAQWLHFAKCALERQNTINSEKCAAVQCFSHAKILFVPFHSPWSKENAIRNGRRCRINRCESIKEVKLEVRESNCVGAG